MTEENAAEKEPENDAQDESKEDRRREPRFAIEDCTVQHRRPGLVSALFGYSREQQPLVNLSGSGVQFLTNDRLDVDEMICLLVRVPGEEDPLKAKGTIVWEGRCEDAYLFRVGVVFSKASEKTWRKLQVLERSSSEPSDDEQ